MGPPYATFVVLIECGMLLMVPLGGMFFLKGLTFKGHRIIVWHNRKSMLGKPALQCRNPLPAAHDEQYGIAAFQPVQKFIVEQIELLLETGHSLGRETR